MFDFEKHLTDLADQTVLCVGDLMLDEFVYGDVSRISPEAATPVIAVKRTEVMVGGAGNVARNLVSLGTRCIFVGVVGGDDAGAVKALPHPLIDFISRWRAPDHAQGAFVPSIIRRICCVPTKQRADRSKRRRVDRPRHQGDGESRRSGAVGLCQGRADAAGHPRRHRRRQQSRQAGGGRSERPRLQHLQGRDADHAEPAGTGRRDPQPGADR